MVEELRVVWSKKAQRALEEHCNHIKKESVQASERVKSEILKVTKSLLKAPTRFPLDKFRKNNKGDIRAFEKFSLRVAYQVKKKEIVIVRIRHVKRSPLEY